jgi:hypothetical protein
VSIANARDSFQFYSREYPELYRHLLRSLPADVLAILQSGARTGWVLVEVDVLYVDAVLQFLGREPMKAALRRFIGGTLVKQPILRSVIQGVTALFGVGVGPLLRAVPPGMDQSYRESFALRAEHRASEAHFVFDDIAPELLRSEAYFVVWEAAFLALYDLARAQPRVELRADRAARRADVTCRY